MTPGVVSRDCKAGVKYDLGEVEIGFVGSRGYHPEHPWRETLISFLEATYGNRFRVYTGYREQALNDLYASLKVVVGDSCFNGKYGWSDRIPESLGRGALLIHQECPGLCIPGLVTYKLGDLNDLADKIDYNIANPCENAANRIVAQNWIKNHDTYENRMRRIMSQI
jgi:hypothetical protein